MVYPIDDCHDHNNNSKYHCMDRRSVECRSSFLSSEWYPAWRATHHVLDASGAALCK